MARTMEAIEENLRSCHGAIRAPLAYVIRKNVMAKTYSDYPKYATLDYQIIARMLHLPLDKNKLFLEYNVHSVKEQTAEYDIDNRSVYDILDQICKSICQTAQVPEGWQRGNLCHLFQIGTPKSCQNSIKS